eukprot:3240420-Karenia_brevis.AAC.1
MYLDGLRDGLRKCIVMDLDNVQVRLKKSIAIQSTTTLPLLLQLQHVERREHGRACSMYQS